jgi:hypothetical protein
MIDISMFKEGDGIVVHKKKLQGISDIPAPVIRVLTGCYYNHTAIITKCFGRLFITESIAKGLVSTQTLESYLNEIGSIREIMVIRVNDADIDKANDNLVNIINRAYGFGTLIFTQLFYQITKKIFGKKNGLWLGKSGDAAKRTIVCSEAYANMYPGQFTEIPLERVTPKDIFETIRLKNVTVVYESNTIARMKFEKKYKIS